MPHRDSAPVGAPCWVDLMTSDIDRTRAFYGELFGWTSEDPGPEFGGYVNFSKDGVLVAGCMPKQDEAMPDLWSVYLATGDAAATVDTAKAHGSEVIVPAMPVGELGVMAVVTDPGAAVIGMWQPALHKGFGIYDEADTPAWFELHTRDYDAAVKFYETVFKWETHVEGDTPEFRYTTLGHDPGLAGIMDASGFLPEGIPSHWSVYFRVDDADAALGRIDELGGATVQPPEDTPYGRLAQATDPTGALFKLVAGS